MEDEDAWARVSLRVSVEGCPADWVEATVALPGDLERRVVRGDHWWLVDLYETGDESIDQQLDSLVALLREHRSGLVEVGARTDVNVMISWTPRRGQDSVGFDADLIALLASVNGRIILDTHTDDD